MAPPEMSAVVLQWNHVELTARCVASLRSDPGATLETVIVDNGSEREAAAWASTHADVAVSLPSNQGFAAGMNAGLGEVRGAYVVFVNNDTEFPAGWAGRLIDALDPPGVGLVAPAVTSAGNVSSVRTTPGTGRRLARPFIDLPSGVVYAMRADLIRAIGGWREDYPLASGEDLDLLFTLWTMGYDVVIDDTTLIDHVGSATARDLPEKRRIWSDNRRLLVDRWYGMDEAAFRERYGWDGPVDAERLDQARIAAYWMGRLFTELDARPAAAPPAVAPPDRRRWWSRGR